MSLYGRLGVVVPDVSDMLDIELLQGIAWKAKKLGYSTIVFTSAVNIHENETELDGYISGQENIYELAVNSELDGILFAAGRFFNKRLKNRILEMLKGSGLPCVVMGEENADLPYSTVSQRESIEMLTDHLIGEHGCRKVYCLTGPKEDREAQERLGGYRRAMDRAHLSCDNSIFYGDFWYGSARRLAEQIASGELEKPDAVVCCSDIMANALCDALREKGIGVPEDIKITGYDGSLFAHMHDPAITTVTGKEICLGELSVCRMHELLTGEKVSADKFRQSFCGGESCGCSHIDGRIKVYDYFRNMVWRKLDRKHYITSDHIAKLSDAESLAELAMNADILSGMLSGWTHMDICLCRDWKIPFDNPNGYRRKGYSENMLLILSKSKERSDMGQYEFPTEYILPRIKNTAEPIFAMVTSLHSSDQIFGYAVTEYKDVRDMSIDEHYVGWCDAFSNGLKNLQKKEYSEYVKKQMEQNTIYDFATGLYNIRGFLSRLSEMKAEHIILTALVCRRDDTTYNGDIDPSMIIANTLQMSERQGEIAAICGRNVFIAAYPSEEDGERRAEEWTEDFIGRLHRIRGGIPFAAEDEIFFEHKVMEEKSTAEEEIRQLCEKAADRIRPERKSTSHADILGRIRSEITFSPQESWSVPDIAQKAGLSLSRFHRVYREQFGISCMEDIISARISKAKHLLVNTSLSVQEISEKCGYENASHFMRQFKSREGVSALKYRQMKKTTYNDM